MPKGVEIGTFTIGQEDLETVIDSPLGGFTFERLTPNERASAEGEISRRFNKAPISSVDPSVYEVMRSAVYLDWALPLKGGRPEGFTTFSVFYDDKFILDMFAKYADWLESKDKLIRKKVEAA